MGTVLSAKLRTSTGLTPQTRASGRWRRGDVWSVAILVALPVLVFGVPALLGHSVLPADDLTQSFPLRVLAGRELRGGQLPLYDPYIWSGAPLLAGWNAGAAYPLTFLFATLPATAAWTANLIITWAVAGLGMFCFLRALRLGSLPSLLGGLSFAFAGAPWPLRRAARQEGDSRGLLTPPARRGQNWAFSSSISRARSRSFS